MSLTVVLDKLHYSQSQFYLETAQKHEPQVASLFRVAQSAGVDGIYVFQMSNQKDAYFPFRPAVYIAEAQNPEEARTIHRRLWNMGQAPFLIVKLPNHVRVYTGFNYSRDDEDVGVIVPFASLDSRDFLEQLGDFCAEAVDTGEIWRKCSQHLNPEYRVDKQLLKNLSELGQFLRAKMKISSKVAHALIGKYVYIRYLRDRDILSDQWLRQHNINIDLVLGRSATVDGLRQLCDILDNRFNGSIFPLDFGDECTLNNEHIAQVAAIFKGDNQSSVGRQLSLDFQVYDFAYIPIELLSSIYEQFLHAEGKGEAVGAYYTPEYLADYLISEMNLVQPLKEGMKILDPACGSGVFLVLIYARLIEVKLAEKNARILPLAELLGLLEHLYGIERELDACYVTEFSLILMLLHYADIQEFLFDRNFKFPSLHNTHVFQCDFFDDNSPVWIENIRFDWIIGNPPWIAASSTEDPFVTQWILTHRNQRPVDNNSVAEAFSWRVLDLLKPTGYIGLILPASLLYNANGKKYRQKFFQLCEVRRVTNFSNTRSALFEGRTTAPAATIIYHPMEEGQEKSPIEHYGPFTINQITKSHDKLWTITINEHEYQTVSPYEAEYGDSATWKFALWGTHRDKRAIARLRKYFPLTLGELSEDANWHLYEGPQLRNGVIEHTDKLEHLPFLNGKKRLNTKALNNSGHLFSIPESALEDIPPEECYIRIQGGRKGLLVSDPPHIVIHASLKYCIYSDSYFVVRPRQIGLAAPESKSDYLRALSVFLSSSLVRYYLFFQAPQWGIERDRITLDSVKGIPIPLFNLTQMEQLASLHKELVALEYSQDINYAQSYLDTGLMRILQIPESIRTLVTEFLQVRSKLVGGGTKEALQMVQGRPSKGLLQTYAQQLTSELDGFLDSSKTHHRVTIEHSKDLIRCTVDFLKSNQPFTPVIKEVFGHDSDTFSKLTQSLREEFSQWVYVQRGLRLFRPTGVTLYKTPQLINWTRTEAMNDADDLIAEILSTTR